MKTTDFTSPANSRQLNESMYKKFGVKVNFDKYTREQLENYRNLLRTKLHQQEVSANFNELLSNESYQKDKHLVGVLTQRIKEMLGESINVMEKAVSKSQQQAAGIALAAKKAGKKPAGKGAAAEMAKMSTKELEKFAGTKHKGLPKKKATTEGAKPDFLDMDKDGDKKEPMKKAVADKKKKPFEKVKEADERPSAKKSEREVELPSGAKVKATKVQGWRSQKSDKEAEKDVKEATDARPAAKKTSREVELPSGAKVKATKVQGWRSQKSDKESEKVEEGAMKDAMWKDAEQMSRKQFCDKYGAENGEFWDNINDDVMEATKPLKSGQKKLDTDKDGDIDAKDMKNLRDKKKVKESQLKHLAYQRIISESLSQFIAEDEEGKAKSITAGTDMVNDFTSWMTRIGQYQTKSMIELADAIRANFGQEQAEMFKQSVAPALETALNTLTQVRETLSGAVAVLAGEQPAMDQMGTEMDGEMDGMDDMDAVPAPEDEMNAAPEDEFAAADAAAGGSEISGRVRRESRELFAKKLDEAHMILTKLSK